MRVHRHYFHAPTENNSFSITQSAPQNAHAEHFNSPSRVEFTAYVCVCVRVRDVFCSRCVNARARACACVCVCVCVCIFYVVVGLGSHTLGFIVAYRTSSHTPCTILHIRTCTSWPRCLGVCVRACVCILISHLIIIHYFNYAHTLVTHTHIVQMSTHTHTHAKTTHTTLTTHACHFLCVCENRISVHSAPCEGPHFVAAVIEPQSAFSACENVSDDEVCVCRMEGGGRSQRHRSTDRPISNRNRNDDDC